MDDFSTNESLPLMRRMARYKVMPTLMRTPALFDTAVGRGVTAVAADVPLVNAIVLPPQIGVGGSEASKLSAENPGQDNFGLATAQKPHPAVDQNIPSPLAPTAQRSPQPERSVPAPEIARRAAQSQIEQPPVKESDRNWGRLQAIMRQHEAASLPAIEVKGDTLGSPQAADRLAPAHDQARGKAPANVQQVPPSEDRSITSPNRSMADEGTHTQAAPSGPLPPIQRSAEPATGPDISRQEANPLQPYAEMLAASGLDPAQIRDVADTAVAQATNTVDSLTQLAPADGGKLVEQTVANTGLPAQAHSLIPDRDEVGGLGDHLAQAAQLPPMVTEQIANANALQDRPSELVNDVIEKVAVPAKAHGDQIASHIPSSVQQVAQSMSPMPLQDAWPVQGHLPQQVQPPTLPNREQIEQTLSAAVNAEQVPQMIAAEKEKVLAHLSTVAPGQPTNSGVPLMRPRRPRPQLPGMATAVADSLPLPTLPDLPAPGGMQNNIVDTVNTQIGQLPPDLWQLIGQKPPPALAKEAQETVSSAGEQGEKHLQSASEQGEAFFQSAGAQGNSLLQSTANQGESLLQSASNQGGSLLQSATDQGETLLQSAGEQVQEGVDTVTGLPDAVAGLLPQMGAEKTAQPEIDIETVARQVYERIKQRLSIERERFTRL